MEPDTSPTWQCQHCDTNNDKKENPTVCQVCDTSRSRVRIKL